MPRTGTVPANLPAVAWWFGRSYYDELDDSDAGGPYPVMTTADDLVLECGDETANRRTIAVDVEVTGAYALIAPKTAFVAGESCSLHSRVVRCDLSKIEGFWHKHDMSYLTGRANFTVGASAPLPDALGVFEIEPAKVEPIELTEGAGCSGIDDVCATRGTIALSDGARPWRDAFVYETRVDGKPWRLPRAAPLPLDEGSSHIGRGREILFAKRPGASSRTDVRGLSVGRHSVVIRAYLPGTQVTLETEPVEIDLNCFASEDAGVPALNDAGLISDRDAAEIDRDGEMNISDAGSPKPRRRSSGDRSGASSCNLVGLDATGTSLPAFVLLSVFGILVRRRTCAGRGARGPRCSAL
jgi:hypothetical protein